MEYSNKTNQFLSKIDQTCQNYQLIRPGLSILCAISGGPDSVCLLKACLYLQDKYNYQLAIAHIHHGLRGDNADRDARFVQNLAKNANIPFHLKQVNVFAYKQRHKCCLEEAARDLRYESLKDICLSENYNTIALGHNADDTAEQLLMNLIRGTGPRGLIGIVPRRKFSDVHNITIIRPLIHVYRDEIEAFLARSNQVFMHDETNDNTNFLRNRIRHHLIPILESYNPQIKVSLNRLADIQRIDTQWQTMVAEQTISELMQKEQHNQITLKSRFLKSNHLSVVRSVFRQAINKVKGNLRRITHDHIQTLSNWLMASDKSRLMHLPDKIFVKITNNEVNICKGAGNLQSSSALKFCYCIEEPGKIKIPECNMILQLDLLANNYVKRENYLFSENNVFLDADVVSFPIIVRSIEAGDYFQPLGMTGHQKLKKFLSNQKIPRSRRSQIPVLISQNKIVWVVGLRISQSASLDPSTQRVLECRCIFNQ